MATKEHPHHILVVDDEETLCEALRFNLEAEGYEVSVAYSAEEALALDFRTFDLILLDIMMGAVSGIRLARMIKSDPATSNIPIIFCTARDDVEDMVAGLNLGADDYITKPYSLRNVLARVKAVLRRTTGDSTTTSHASHILECCGLRVDTDSKQCTVDGKDVAMPRKEFEILATLMTDPGHIFSREELLAKVWPEQVVVVDRVVDVHITRLRAKIAPYGKHIITRAGYGYGFKP
ncbi:response regulators consisting of a CheY-like receiver domain and a winged-helix DNA-binding domain [Prevotella sp. CAG:873]|nr:response regulators consisting of a CheY-like receiver domain and a winged-helix DNA-binding domain [Prevotella sp. CAG:873]